MDNDRLRLRRVAVKLGDAIVKVANGLLEHPDNTELRQAFLSEEIAPSMVLSSLLRVSFRLLMIRRAQCSSDSPHVVSHDTPTTPENGHFGNAESTWVRLLYTIESGFFERLMDESRLHVMPLKLPLRSCACDDDLVEEFRIEIAQVDDGLGEAVRLGQLYEALLGQSPVKRASRLVLTRKKGYARKSAGAYYTPSHLVDFCVKRALSPFMSVQKTKVSDDWSVHVCDPSCGDGQFLVHTFRQLEAQIGTESVEPSRVVRMCYGVDIDPQAIELARFNLASCVQFAPCCLEAIRERIQCGNALWALHEGKTDDADGTKTEAVSSTESGQANFINESALGTIFSRCGGFDVVLGNPPWEKLEVLEREYFAAEVPALAHAKTVGERKRQIEELSRSRTEVYRRYLRVQAALTDLRSFVRHGGQFPLSAHGRLNLYSLFTELATRLINKTGFVVFLLPTGIVTDFSTRFLTQALLERRQFVSVIDFDNRSRFFEDVQGNVQFCLLQLSAKPHSSFFVSTGVRDLKETAIQSNAFTLTHQDVRLMNPETKSIPMFTGVKDRQIIGEIYARLPTLQDSDWHPVLRQGSFNMTTGAHHFYRMKESDTLLPLYEAKLCAQFNHRHATFEGVAFENRFGTHAGARRLGAQELASISREPLPRYWVQDAEARKRIKGARWLLVYRNAFSCLADARSLNATIIPESGVGNSLSILTVRDGARGAAVVVAVLNSFLVDYVARQKSTGSNLNFYVLRQLPVLNWDDLAKPRPWTAGRSLIDWIVTRSLELCYTSESLRPFASDLSYAGHPFGFNEDRRAHLRAELDAAVFLAFGVSRSDVTHIMASFPVLERRELKIHGAFRTKLHVLEAYDRLANHLPTSVHLD